MNFTVQLVEHLRVRDVIDIVKAYSQHVAYFSLDHQLCTFTWLTDEEPEREIQTSKHQYFSWGVANASFLPDQPRAFQFELNNDLVAVGGDEWGGLSRASAYPSAVFHTKTRQWEGNIPLPSFLGRCRPIVAGNSLLVTVDLPEGTVLMGFNHRTDVTWERCELLPFCLLPDLWAGNEKYLVFVNYPGRGILLDVYDRGTKTARRITLCAVCEYRAASVAFSVFDPDLFCFCCGYSLRSPTLTLFHLRTGAKKHECLTTDFPPESWRTCGFA